MDAGVSPVTGEMIQWESDGSLEVVHTNSSKCYEYVKRVKSFELHMSSPQESGKNKTERAVHYVMKESPLCNKCDVRSLAAGVTNCRKTLAPKV